MDLIPSSLNALAFQILFQRMRNMLKRFGGVSCDK